MLDLSNFIRLFHRQSFTLYGSYVRMYICNTQLFFAFQPPFHIMLWTSYIFEDFDRSRVYKSKMFLIVCRLACKSYLVILASELGYKDAQEKLE